MITALVMFIIPTLMYVTFRSSAVQTYLARKAAAYLSRELDADIHVGGVDIRLFLTVVLEDVEIHDKKNQPLLVVERMYFDVNRISLSRRNLIVSKLLFDNARVGLARYQGDEHHNFQFLIDYFISDAQTDTFEVPRWDVVVRSFEFRQGELSFNDYHEPEKVTGFDPSHFLITGFNLDIRDICWEDQIMEAELKHFNLQESRGFNLKNISASLFFSPKKASLHDFQLLSDHSRLHMDMNMQYQGYESLKSLFNGHEVFIDLKPSYVGLNELGHFVTGLYGIDEKIGVSGVFSGNPENLNASMVKLQYGRFTEFTGHFNLVGLPNVQQTFMNLSVESFSTSHNDLESFCLPQRFNAPYLKLPDEIKNLGTASFKGNFAGFLHDFVAQGRLQTNLGSVSTNLAIKSNEDFSRVNYHGNVSSRDFNLRKLFNQQNDFGKMSLDASIKGTSYRQQDFDMDLSVELHSLEFKQYEYSQMRIAGHYSNQRFNGQLLIDDPNLFVDFNGLIDLREEIPRLNFTAQIEDANLTALNIYQRDTLYDSQISTIISVDGKGSNFANIEGEVTAFQTHYKEIPVHESDSMPAQSYHTAVMFFENTSLQNGHKLISFVSDFMDVKMEGEIRVDEVVPSFRRLFYTYAPSRFSLPPRILNGDSPHQKAEIEIFLKETKELTDIFLPNIQVAPHTLLKGHIDTQSHTVVLDGTFDHFAIGGSRIHQMDFNLNSDSQNIELYAYGEKLFLSDTIWIEEFFASANVFQDTMVLLTQWENKNSPYRNLGHVEAMGRFVSPTTIELGFRPSYAYINDSIWSIRPDNQIIWDSTSVIIDNFFLYKNQEYLKVDGKLSNNPEDVLQIAFNAFNIESLRFLLGSRKIDFSGLASGDLSLSNLRATPNIIANLHVEDFAFNQDHLGDLSLHSQWDAAQKAFRVDSEVIYHGNVGSHTPIVINGYFYPEREDDNFDLDIVIENLKMSVFSRYVESFASNFRGMASGRLRLDGPTDSPELSGTARLVRTGFRVDYLNTSYSFAHEVEVGKDYFRFDNLALNDTLGNSARVSGVIKHNNFLDFEVDIRMWPERLVVLNTRPRHNSLFFGKAFATGLVHVHGSVRNVVMDISAQANRGTQFFLPLDYQGEIAESSFITFVEPETVRKAEPVISVQDVLGGFTMNFDLEVTPEAEVQIIFDSQIGDILRGRGFGDLKFEIDNQGAFHMYGDYTIQDGDYLFTLQNLINKRFRIEQGGTIRWMGDPYDADIDIRALYRLRTSLFDLAANQTDTSDVYRRRVPVETVLHLKDKLFNPSISFDIQLPGGDESTREMIARIITTEQEMNRQVFSLLVLNRFVPPEDGFNTALSYGMGSTSSELLSNQLSNWLSQISSDFDIGINYRPGDEISSQEIEVALSTQLFDDRVIIDGNVGVAGEHPAQTQRASNIIGDVNVEVKITPEGKFRVKAFNRSNTFDVLNTNAPYTQGVGVFYRREFDSLSELFRRKRSRVPETSGQQDTESIESHLPE